MNEDSYIALLIILLIIFGVVGWALNDVYRIMIEPTKFITSEDRIEQLESYAFDLHCRILPNGKLSEMVYLNCDFFRQEQVDNFNEWCLRNGGEDWGGPDWCSLPIKQTQTNSGSVGREG